MYIRANEENRIQLVSVFERPGSVAYDGELPEDFTETFSLGKYLFVVGEIVLNDAWDEASGTLISLPNDVPHRELLLSAGISSIEELQEIEDLTSIQGIGKSKAADIHDYLTTNKK